VPSEQTYSKAGCSRGGHVLYLAQVEFASKQLSWQLTVTRFGWTMLQLVLQPSRQASASGVVQLAPVWHSWSQRGWPHTEPQQDSRSRPAFRLAWHTQWCWAFQRCQFVRRGCCCMQV